jgi:hypothetical protein
MRAAIILQHVVRPARGGAGAVVAVFSVGLWVASYAGLLGIPLLLILSSWSLKYAYILFDHTVRGFDEPPVLDIKMVNPVDEWRPLAQLAILGTIGLLVKWVAFHSPPAVGTGFAVLALLVVPASVCELGLDGNPVAAVNPAALFRLIRALGTLYVLVIAVVAGYALVLDALWQWDAWRLVQTAAGMFALFSVFSLLAGAAYERRHRVGIDTWRSPEQDAAAKAVIDRRESERVLAEAYGLVRAGAQGRASELIRSWLSQRGGALADYRWLCEKLKDWGDDRFVTIYTQEYVDKLWMVGERGEALTVVANRVAADERFRPASARSTLAVAQLAAVGGGRPKLARILLADFSDRFAGDPHCAAATALARRLAL